MGASGVVDLIEGKTPASAYSNAVQQARYEHGSGGYTGSIAESDGYVMHSARTLLQWEAMQVANQLLHGDKVRKWGPTVLIPIADAVSTRKIAVAIDTTNVKDYEEKNDLILAAIRSKLRAGESILSADSTTETKTKVVTTAAEGDTKTVYFVKSQHGRHGAQQYPTLTAAKAAAKAALERDKYADAFYITKQVTKGDSAALVTIAKKTTKAATTITAVIGKPKAGAVTKWVAVGWYSE